MTSELPVMREEIFQTRVSLSFPDPGLLQRHVRGPLLSEAREPTRASEEQAEESRGCTEFGTPLSDLLTVSYGAGHVSGNKSVALTVVCLRASQCIIRIEGCS